ncbi:MAG: 23S rRNA (guanosine(2251)-2'-O)-methyltransferase RlmB [Clostridia bacterium]|nr:23S rRNA (guanosine(2251)-2'-O)-methyltransferase RlmB [Clostridia bacterium]
MIIEGRNAVKEALRSNTTIEKVLIAKDIKSNALFDLMKECKKSKIVYQMVENNVLDKYSPSKHHQGIIAFCTEYKYYEMSEILENKKGDNHFLVILDGIEDPHNLGAIIRTCECANVDGIIIPKRHSCGVTDTAVKVSVGASSYVKVCKVGNINDAIRELKEQGIYIFAADMDGASIYDTNLTGDIAIVIGGEGSGVHDLTKKLCDSIISLPQLGNINSLNASVACGISVYEALRQRLGK